ncbi:isocitrate/isopropylmalate dehydrogenase family protein [Peptostreptococcus canis]|uniref:Isocitrate/isopropylmalate dehydrogenase family protein n=1 Tax=Peptostreptococcus canis TaxID=1159213 RepID=A0ABR6TKA2_9FIRM|nr:isocitrate/isopropylmalate dehydrogenase family protein [Peptostreptococcus canis]MBC2575619.1 isocitrate/isopropylmalate dehydrogenase family protein [Peptostreptococcus canis]MBP1997177.1 isocitrate dehydrogenase (NAD+) [Peptostreptococcus canis]
MYDITLIPGDGIGLEVTESMKKVVETAGVEINWEEMIAGEKVIDKYKTPLPEYVIESIKKNKIAIKGPITTPVGKGFRSVNVALRKELNLYANVRPIKSFDGIKSRYSDIDFTIIRENTEDLYAGIEHKIGDYAGESIKLITRDASERIVDFACKYTKDNDYKRLSCVHKANIMKISDGLFLKVFDEICNKNGITRDGEDIYCDDVIVDAAAMNLVLNPELFNVLVMPNLYGDILSDLGAGLVGGLGIIPSANIGKDYAIFEAVHGSAPQIAGKGIANPTAIIQSAVMMLRYIGEHKAAILIENGLKKIFKEGKVITVDLGGNASTKEFTDELCRIIKNSI